MAMANDVNAGRKHHEIYAYWRVTMGHRMLFHGSLPPCVDLHSLVSRKISLLPMAFPFSPVSLMVFRIIMFAHKVFHGSLFHRIHFHDSLFLRMFSSFAGFPASTSLAVLDCAWLCLAVLCCAWLRLAAPGCA